MKIDYNSIKLITQFEVKEALNNLLVDCNEDSETIKYLMKEHCKNAYDTFEIREILQGMGLYLFEIYQLIEFKPKNFLTLQLIIDEMEERFGKEDLEKIIQIINLQ